MKGGTGIVLHQYVCVSQNREMLDEAAHEKSLAGRFEMDLVLKKLSLSEVQRRS